MVSWMSRLSPVPSFPPYSGPYDVGTVDVEVPASDVNLGDEASSPSEPPVPTVAFRCFYPCKTSSNSGAPVYWIQNPQKSTLSAFVRFLGASPTVSGVFASVPQLLYYIKIPAHRDAPLLPCPNPTHRWPVLVFSHGLGGTRNSYSYLCGALASHGLVVVAADHRDGSAPLTYYRTPGKEGFTAIEYNKMPMGPSEETFKKRDAQLRVRAWELASIHQALLRLDRGENLVNLNDSDTKKQRKSTAPLDKPLSTFSESLDVHEPGAICWMGHSFGAATMVQFLKTVFYHHNQQPHHNPLLSFTPPSSLLSQITPASPTALLDLWALPLSSPATTFLKSQPMPCFSSTGPGGSALLAILSEAFVKWPKNLRYVKTTLSDPSTPGRPAAHIFYPLSSAHLSQSDFAIIFPRITKYVAKAREPERTMRLNIRAVLQMLRASGVRVADTSAADAEADAVSAQGDWKILSREPDAVRAWVALRADDETAVNGTGGDAAEVLTAIVEGNGAAGHVPLDDGGDANGTAVEMQAPRSKY